MASPLTEPRTPPPLVLLANDQEWSSRSLESVLGPHGFATVRAYTGRQALELVRSAKVDAVIVDSRLPDVSGLDLLRLFQEETAFQPGTPVVLLSSGASTRAQRLEAHEAGAWELMSAPLDIEALVLKLELFVRAKREADKGADSGLLDAATGFYNPRGLARRAREVGADAARRAIPVSCVAMMVRFPGGPVMTSDLALDAEGKAFLRLAEACRSVARASDVIGRLGRNELVVIAPGATAEGARRMVARVREMVTASGLTLGAESRGIDVVSGVATEANFATASSDLVSLLLNAAGGLREERGTTPASGETVVAAAR